MPAKRSSKKAAAEAPPPPEAKADEPAATGDERPDDEQSDMPPLNRAERRAKAKGKGVAPSSSKVPVIRGGSRGPAPSPRQWASRRSG